MTPLKPTTPMKPLKPPKPLMSFMPRRLTLAVGAGALSLATVLSVSSCSTLEFQRVGMGIGTYKTSWTVGSCHRLDQLIETDAVYDSDTSPAVSCAGAHESETFAVEPITGAVARQAERPTPEWLQSALNGTCTAKVLDTFLGVQATDSLDDVSVLRIVPSASEWQAGVRKVRCDALIGPRTTQAVATISRSLRGIIATAAGNRFRSCRLGDVELSCDGLHTVEQVNPPVKFTDAELAEGHDYVLKKVTAACDAAVAAYVGAPLSKRPDLKLYPDLPGEYPHIDSKIGECWVGPASGLSTTGSVRRTGPGRVS